jgi:hypothetical protein
MNDILRLVKLSDGARASARFNVHGRVAFAIPGSAPVHVLMRRERRAPLVPEMDRPIFRFQ